MLWSCFTNWGIAFLLSENMWSLRGNTNDDEFQKIILEDSEHELLYEVITKFTCHKYLNNIIFMLGKPFRPSSPIFKVAFTVSSEVPSSFKSTNNKWRVTVLSRFGRRIVIVIIIMQGVHSFSAYAKFSEKVIFYSPWYAHVWKFQNILRTY